MKKLILLLCVLFGMNGYAQIGEVRQDDRGEMIGSLNKMFTLEVKDKGDENLYILTYRNAAYDYILDLQNILFYGSDIDLNKFYEFLKSADENRKSLQVGKFDVSVSTYNKKYIMIHVYPEDDVDGNFTLTHKELDKLFGKA